VTVSWHGGHAERPAIKDEMVASFRFGAIEDSVPSMLQQLSLRSWWRNSRRWPAAIEQPQRPRLRLVAAAICAQQSCSDGEKVIAEQYIGAKAVTEKGKLAVWPTHQTKER